ncbi:histidinol dehydrogenase [Streptomyces sp. NPDC006365]|uniref:histidinol dehydrogenase n=1 Tax=Streptomyces sp. NPDC006365 TaxID=3364744 RepID=UPI003678AE4A
MAAAIADVRVSGDDAVRRYSEAFDRWSPGSFRLSEDEVRGIVSSVPETVLDDIRFAQAQVRRFARVQRESLHEFEIETLPGVFLGQRNIPVQASGAHVPGGRYPLTASAHMTVLTAKEAGVERVAATTPPSAGLPPTCVAYGDKVIGTNHADPRFRSPHRRAVGGQVPENGHLPGGPQPRQQRAARRGMRSPVPAGTLRGTCSLR